MRNWLMGVVVLSTLLLFSGARAMESSHYRLDWLMVAVGSDGESASSHFRTQFTVGQTAIGSGSSSHYAGQWGYWPGGGQPLEPTQLYLPVILKDA